MKNSKESSFYLIIQRKLFNRLALPYEVILDSWCCSVNGQTLIEESVIEDVIRSSGFSEDKVVLKLEGIRERKTAYSFSNLDRIIFSSNESCEKFLNVNYDNFDVSSLDCTVLECFDEMKSDSKYQIELPSNPASKSMMTPIDGFLALLFDKITVEKKSKDYFRYLSSSDCSLKDLIVLFFDSDIIDKKDEAEVFRIFIDLCFENSLDLGWDPESIHQNLIKKLSDDVSGSDRLKSWSKRVEDLLSGTGGSSIPLDDDGSVVLRSIILLLLNPEFDKLLAIKESLGPRIGKKVFDTAKKFALLRSGYSLFNFQERAALGDMREFFQDFNAALYNHELQYLLISDNKDKELYLESNESIEETTNLAKVDLSKVSFVSSLLEQVGESKVYSIEGITPNAGFKSVLVDQNEKGIFLWLIDLRNDDKNSKYKGKMALDLLKIQSELPKDYRFEVDELGVFLRLPRDISNEIDLLNILKLIFKELAFIKAFNVRKSSFI